jgi:hypothetical protein
MLQNGSATVRILYSAAGEHSDKLTYFACMDLEGVSGDWDPFPGISKTFTFHK